MWRDTLLLLLIFLLLQIEPLHSSQHGPGIVNFGVVLDLETLEGKMSKTCISLALRDFYRIHSNYTTRLTLHTRDSQQSVIGAASAAFDLLKNVEVQAIIGPQRSHQAELVGDIGVKVQVPIISFSATCPSLSTSQIPYFIRAAQNDTSQVKAIAAIVKRFSWREVVTIYEDTTYGKGVIPYLIDALQEIEARVPFRTVLHPSATDDKILVELYKLMTMQTRVFVVHMGTSLGSRFFLKAQEVGMMSNGYAWIITGKLTSFLGSMDSSVIDSMHGVLGVKPFVPESKALGRFRVRWKREFGRENPDIKRPELNIYGLWAYDSIWALAMAVEKSGGSATGNFNYHPPFLALNTTDLAALRVSPTGPKLLEQVKKTRFKGLSGDFQLVDGELQSSVYQIVNVIRNRQKKVVGFWTPTGGISQNLMLGGVIWPGESKLVPRGWVIPTNGRKFRVGFPHAKEIRIFIRQTKDPKTNRTVVSGFSIDVFEVVMKLLPYAVDYEYVPFENATGQSAGNYDDLVRQVFIGKFDAVAADVTITPNRSEFVDFTLPYADGGISMMVAVKGDKNKNALVFLKPFSASLWVIIMAFFVLTGIVVWLLERRTNPDFRGSATEQVGTFLWFSFSTLVFAQRERIVSNLSRLVVIIWVFVVLILTSSYTASLTSMLTVQKMQPTYKDVDSLIRTGDYVGYSGTSVVLELLKRLNFNESRIKKYKAPHEYAEALSKGSHNGGVDAVFEEIPYIQHFLSLHCHKFTMVGPVYKTGGFGFVFPKGSPLVADVSKAILYATQGEEMVTIEEKWLGGRNTCLDVETAITSTTLTLDSFRSLFLITGSTSIAALVVFFISFFREHRHIFSSAGLENLTPWQRIVSMAKHFNMEILSDEMPKLKERSHNAGVLPSEDLFPMEGNFRPLGEELFLGELNDPNLDTLVYVI